MTPRVANFLTVLGLVGLLAWVSLTAPRWARLFRQPLPLAEEEPQAARAGASPPPTSQPAPEPPGEAQRTINVKLLFEAADRPGLVLEERSVPFSADLSRQLRLVVEELAKGSESGLLPPLNPVTRVLEVFVTAGGVAYVDLSKEVSEEQAGGSAAELLAVYSIVDTLTENFPAVRRVQILIEGRPAETLAGHVDLSRPLVPDMTLLAPAPAESPAPAAAPAPEARSSHGPQPASPLREGSGEALARSAP